MKEKRTLKYGLKPVERIELDEKNTRRRLIAAIIGIAIAAGALIFALTNLFNVDTSWQAIESDDSAGVSCANEFMCSADVGSHGGGAAGEKKAMTKLYTDATAYAYRLFNTADEFDGMNNLRYINDHPNEAISVPETLYDALNTACAGGDRYIYLGPIYELYHSIIASADDYEAANYDPYRSTEIAAFCNEVVPFVQDPAHVELIFGKNHTVTLRVSDEYLKYASDNGIGAFTDLGWIKNAFIADYIAEAFATNGYTHVIITSRDGYMRNLDERGEEYTTAVYARRTDGVIYRGDYVYTSPCAMAQNRTFPVSGKSDLYNYVYANGDVRTLFISVEDGFNHHSTNSLSAFGQMTCGEIATRLASVFLSDEAFGNDEASQLNAEGLTVVYFDGKDLTVIADT